MPVQFNRTPVIHFHATSLTSYPLVCCSDFLLSSLSHGGSQGISFFLCCGFPHNSFLSLCLKPLSSDSFPLTLRSSYVSAWLIQCKTLKFGIIKNHITWLLVLRLTQHGLAFLGNMQRMSLFDQFLSLKDNTSLSGKRTSPFAGPYLLVIMLPPSCACFCIHDWLSVIIS